MYLQVPLSWILWVATEVALCSAKLRMVEKLECTVVDNLQPDFSWGKLMCWETGGDSQQGLGPCWQFLCTPV